MLKKNTVGGWGMILKMSIIVMFFVCVKYEYAQTDFGLFGGICNISCTIYHEYFVS